jgi:hypothetical protein
MKSHDKHRKNFAIMCTVVGASVTLVSLAMTYSIFTESFRDWPTIMRWVLTLSCCIAIEGTSAALIYGLVYALTGFLERSVAFIGLSAVGIWRRDGAGFSLWRVTLHFNPKTGKSNKKRRRYVTYVSRRALEILAEVGYAEFQGYISLAIEIAQLVAEAEKSGNGQVIDEGKGLLLAILEEEEISPSTIEVLKNKLEGSQEEEVEEEKIEVGVEATA